MSDKISPFAKKVYDLTSEVPKGRVTTYKLIAEELGTRAYRAVGQVLRCNPFAPEIPCHRVVASDGKLGGFMGKKKGSALNKKIKLLKSEGVLVENGRIVDFEEKVWGDW